MEKLTVRVIVIGPNGEEVVKEREIPAGIRPWSFLKTDPFGALLNYVLRQEESSHSNRTTIGWG